ncbi:MAG: hypothetical protein U0797_20555 [Gemmataceae bacterium]
MKALSSAASANVTRLTSQGQPTLRRRLRNTAQPEGIGRRRGGRTGKRLQQRENLPTNVPWSATSSDFPRPEGRSHSQTTVPMASPTAARPA